MASTSDASSEIPLSFMERLSSAVFIHRPSEAAILAPATAHDNSATSPKLILIASWTDAKDVHIAKYVIKYQALYPESQILLVKSTSRLIGNPYRIPPVIAPAVDAIKACLGTTSAASVSPPELLIHIFSNGGSSSIATLYDLYAASATEGQDPLVPPHVTIFDSSPSPFRVDKMVTFLSVGMSQVQGLLAAPIIYAVSSYWWLTISAGLMTDWLAVWGKAHNDHDRNREIRRTYVYSENDALVSYEDVEAHADEAERNGFVVRREKFDGSAHVAHMKMDGERYWKVVRDTWEGTSK